MKEIPIILLTMIFLPRGVLGAVIETTNLEIKANVTFHAKDVENIELDVSLINVSEKDLRLDYIQTSLPNLVRLFDKDGDEISPKPPPPPQNQVVIILKPGQVIHRQGSLRSLYLNLNPRNQIEIKLDYAAINREKEDLVDEVHAHGEVRTFQIHD